MSGRADPVFASEIGTPLHHRNVTRRIFEPTLQRAGLPHLRWHDLRYTFASLLIDAREDVVWLSRQLGHAKPNITLAVSAHVFDRVARAEQTRARLEAG